MHELLKAGAALGTAVFKKKFMLGLIALGAMGAIQVVNMFLQRRTQEKRRRNKKIAHSPRLRPDKREMFHAPIVATENLVRH